MEELLGLMEDEACKLLEQKGLDYSIKLTQPPDERALEKHVKRYPRVIKQDIKNGVYRLTVSMVPDDYRRLD